MKDTLTLAAFALLGAALGGEMREVTTPPATDFTPERQVIEPEEPAAEQGNAEPQEAEKRAFHLHGSRAEAEAACQPGQVVIVIYTNPETCPPCAKLEAALFAPHMHDWLAEWFSIAVVQPANGRIPRTVASLGSKEVPPLYGFTDIKSYTNWMREAHRRLTR